MTKPDDEFSILEHVGRLTLIKKVSWASDGLLKHLNFSTSITDEHSLEAAIGKKGLGRITGQSTKNKVTE